MTAILFINVIIMHLVTIYILYLQFGIQFETGTNALRHAIPWLHLMPGCSNICTYREFWSPGKFHFTLAVQKKKKKPSVHIPNAPWTLVHKWYSKLHD